MCLELCDGGDLSVLLDDRLCNANPAPLSLTETRFYAACVLCALRAVHEGELFYFYVPLTFNANPAHKTTWSLIRYIFMYR